MKHNTTSPRRRAQSIVQGIFRRGEEVNQFQEDPNKDKRRRVTFTELYHQVLAELSTGSRVQRF